MALTGCALLAAARPLADGGWEVVVTRRGRLTGTAVAARGTDPRGVLQSLLDTGEVVEPGVGPAPAATPEESECILRWLEKPGTRLVALDGTWASPAFGAGGVQLWAEGARDSSWRGWLGDQRNLRPVHQPGAAISRIAG